MSHDCLDPTNALAMCGDTSPMNPMVPVKLTIAAIITETARDETTLSLKGSTPTVWDRLSPEVRMSILDADSIRNAVHNAVGMAMVGRLSQYPTPMFPRFHE